MAIFNITPKGGGSNDYLPLSGGTVIGPTTFENTVSMNNATIGDLVVTGNATVTNNLEVNTINGNTTYADYMASGYVKNAQKTIIYANEFNGDIVLRNIDFPHVSIIETAGVANCTNLSSFSAGSAASNLTIGAQTFQGCTALRTVNVSKTTSINNYAFSGCTALTVLSFPNLTTLGCSAPFSSCNALTTISFPNLVSITSSNVFYGLSALNLTLSFPKVTTLYSGGTSPFWNCNCKSIYFNVLTNLSTYINLSNCVTMSFPALTTMTSSGSVQAGSATTLSFPKLTTFTSSNGYYGGLNSMSKLQTLTFDILTTLPSRSIFKGNFPALTTFNAPSLTSIPSYLFSSQSSFAALKTLNCSRVTTIGEYAFDYCTALTTYSFPLVTTIGSYAFQYCTALTTANFPAVTTINTYAFARCTSLTTVSMPNLTTCGANAFYYCTALTTLSLPKVSTMGGLDGCSNLRSVYLGITGTFSISFGSQIQSINCPSATSIYRSTFSMPSYCSNITYFSFPSVTYIGDSGVYGIRSTATVNLAAYSDSSICPFLLTSATEAYSTNLGTLTIGLSRLSASYFYFYYYSRVYSNTGYVYITSISTCNMNNLILPQCTSISEYAFQSSASWNLTTVSLPKASYIGDYAFYYCHSLTTVRLNGITSIPTLGGTHVFSNTTLTSIYVPNSLLASFKTATYWSAYSAKMIGV